MTTRLSFFLLMAVLCIVMLTRVQDAAFTSATMAPSEETGKSLTIHGDSSAPLPATGNLLRTSWTRGSSGLWEGYLAGKAGQDLLDKYYDISALPLKERKASFRKASSTEKSELWRTHLTLWLIKRPDLNKWQRDVILTAISLATPEHFDVRPTSRDWKTKVREPLRSLEEQISFAFSLADAAKIFATLGDDTEAANIGSGSLLLSRINFNQPGNSDLHKKRTDGRSGMQDMMIERSACQCSTESDWCHLSSSCSGSDCTATESGCGSLWSYPCNGASCQ